MKRGDKVETKNHGTVEILHGPERGNTGDRYMVRTTLRAVFTVGADELRPADPRVKTIADVIDTETAIFYRREKTESIARAVLAALDAERAAPLAVGDKVRVVYAIPGYAGPRAGQVGTLRKIDHEDDDLPYFVDSEIGWVHAVERISG